VRAAVAVPSSGEVLPGDLYSPARAADRVDSAIVLCHATGSRRATDDAMAQWLCARGHAVLTFDWRGCVGEPSPRSVMPSAIADDLRAAVTFLQGHDGIDARRIGLFGRGLGGGFAVMAAAADPRIAATVCFSGFGDFSRRTALHLGVEEWARIRDEVRCDPAGDSNATVAATRLLGSHTSVSAGTAAPNPFEFTAESVRALLACRPEEVVHHIAPRPLLIVHATGDAMFPRSEAISLYARCGEGAELAFVETDDHMDMYPGRDERVYEAAMARSDDFLRRQL
jgi:dienelactone hydrolase